MGQHDHDESGQNDHHPVNPSGERLEHGSGGNAQRSLAVASTVDTWGAVIERAARDPHVDIEKFERLLAIKDRIESKDAQRAFNEAVAAARGAIPPIAKNKLVNFTSAKGTTNYRHEDFAEVARTIDPHMAAHGLSYRFRAEQAGQKIKVTCILSHAMGHSEETTLEAAEDHTGNKNSIQAIGSVATYLQRYTIKLALGLAAGADDDGKAASSGTTITDEQAEQIKEELERTGAELGRFCAYYRLDKLTDLPASKFSEAMSVIENAAKKRAVR
jgi:hypothetical protein